MVTRVEAQITKRVIQAREEAGLSRKALAEALSLGEQSYGHYERGRYAFTVEQLLILSRVLSKPVQWFLGIDTGLTEEEAEILHLWRQIDNDVVKRLVRNALRDGAGVPRE